MTAYLLINERNKRHNEKRLHERKIEVKRYGYRVSKYVRAKTVIIPNANSVFEYSFYG